MIKENKDVLRMNDIELMVFTKKELYLKLNENLGILNKIKLCPDESAEKVIDEFYKSDVPNDSIEERIKNAKLKGKTFYQFEISKQINLRRTQQSLDNKIIHTNFLSLVDDNTQKGDSPFLQSHCYTHVGINVKFDPQRLVYSVYFILSQKSLSIEQYYGVKDGIVIVGNMLELSCYLFCVKVEKNQNVNFIVSPQHIYFNKQTAKFAVLIHFDMFKQRNITLTIIGFRRLYFYCVMNCNNPNIPYLQPNFDNSSINLNALEEAYVEMFDFKAFPVKKDVTIESAKADYANGTLPQSINSIQNNMPQNSSNMSVPVKNEVIVLNNSTLNKTVNPNFFNPSSVPKKDAVLEFDFKKPTGSVPPGSSRGTFFQSNFMRNKPPTQQNSGFVPIPEENSVMISSSQKMNIPLHTNERPVHSMNNDIFTDEEIRNNLGTKLQNAELQRNNQMLSQSMTNNTYPTSNNMVHTNSIPNNNAGNYCNQVNTTNTTMNNNLSFSHKPNNFTTGNSNFVTGNTNPNNNTLPLQNKPLNFNPTNDNFFNNNNNKNFLIESSPIPQKQTFNPDNVIMQSANPSNNNVYHTSNNANYQNQNHYQNVNTAYNNNNENISYGGQSYHNNNINSFPTVNSNTHMMNHNNNNHPSNFFTNNQHNINIPKQLPHLHKSKNFSVYTIPNTNPNKWKDNLSIFTNNSIESSNSLKDWKEHYLLHSKFVQANASSLTSNKFILKYNLTQFHILSITIVVPHRREFCNFLNPVSDKSNYYHNTHNNNNYNHHNDKGNANKFFDQTFKTNEKNPKNHINPYISGSAIRFKENKKFEIPQNYYNSIDYYIFRDALNSKNETDKKVLNDNERNNDKILETISRKYLSDPEVNTCNKAFEELYKSKSCYDMLVILKNEEVPAHKIVLVSKSLMFKEMIQKNELNNGKYQNELIKILMPESFKVNIFKEILFWIYCGKISENLDILTLRDMLLMADSLKIYPLQKLIIVKYILPKMTKETSIMFVKDSFKRAISSENKDVWNLLSNFSLNCIAKHSSSLIKNKRNEFLGMDIDLLMKCVEQSVFYLVEESHLGNLIRLIIDRGFATDIYDLLSKISKPYMNAQNYHCQNVDLTEILTMFDCKKPVEIKLINDECVEDPIQGDQDKNKNAFDDFFEKREGKKENIKNNDQCKNVDLSKSTVEIELKKNQNHPSSNFVQTINIKNNKKPTFSFNFQINYQELSSCTIFSEAFNTSNRSWSLKLDISKQGDISFYLVERGSPSYEKAHSFYSIYQDKFSLKFYSVLFEFEIKDISFEKSGVIFHSFSSQQHQIIGYENFFNIKQLGKKDVCCFNVWVKEFTLHSACLQHICDNFQLLIQKKKVDSIETNASSTTNNNQQSQIGNKTESQTVKNDQKCFYDLPATDLAYITSSDSLKVDNENTLFSAIYFFCINKTSNEIENLMNTIRYNFVDLKLLCTAARDHSPMRNSVNFKAKFLRELFRRFRDNMDMFSSNRDTKEKPHSIITEILSSGHKDKSAEKKDNLLKLVENKPRKYYSLRDENKRPFNIIIELSDWFLDSDHHTGYIKEVDKVNKCV